MNINVHNFHITKCLQVFRWCGRKSIQDDPGDKFQTLVPCPPWYTSERSLLPPRQSLHTRDGGESITLQRCFMMLGWCWMSLWKKGSSESYAPATQRPSPTLGAKSVIVGQSTATGTLGNLTSHLCWAWLAQSGWIYMQGLPQQMTGRSHF